MREPNRRLDASQIYGSREGHITARIRYLGLALSIALLAAAAAALASTGALSPKGCIADPINNPDGCAKIAAGLDHAQSVAVSPDRNSVYAIGDYDSAIVRFDRDTTTGALTPKGCVADADHNPDNCTKTANGLDGAALVAVSPDAKSVYATSGIESGDNAVVRFNRDTTTGALAPKGCIADPANNPDGCTKTAPGLDGVYGVAVSADGKSVYVAGTSDNAIVRFDRDPTTGALKPKGCVGDADNNPDNCTKTVSGLDGPISVAVSPDGRSVYATSFYDNAIVRFDRDPTTGALKPKGCIADPANNPDGCTKTGIGLDAAYSVAVSADGKSAYAAGLFDNAIVRFRRDATTGALAAKDCIADPANNPDGCANTAKGLDGIHSVVVSPDGKSVYAVGDGDDAIARFDRDTTTGGLTPKGCIADPTDNPDNCVNTAKGLYGAISVAVSPEGTSVYATGPNDNALVLFDRSL